MPGERGALSSKQLAQFEQACLRIGEAMVGRYGAYHGGSMPLDDLESAVLKWIDRRARITRTLGSPGYEGWERT